jgi:hypothetical protein
VSDCGSFLYTASFAERNLFRSTAFHNTPRVDGVEMNIIDPRLLWHVQYHAAPELRSFEATAERDRLVGSHAGYERLDQPVRPVRTITLAHARHSLTVVDTFEGAGRHRVEVPLHLAIGVEATSPEAGRVELRKGGRCFLLEWGPVEAWTLELGSGRVSPSYGVAIPAVRLLWRREGDLAELNVRIAPSANGTPAGAELAEPLPV